MACTQPLGPGDVASCRVCRCTASAAVFSQRGKCNAGPALDLCPLGIAAEGQWLDLDLPALGSAIQEIGPPVGASPSTG